MVMLKKTLETIPVEQNFTEFFILEPSNLNRPLRVVVRPRSNMASHGIQYTVDRTERGIVSDHATPQPMQRVQIKNDIATIRAYKDARTARIKSIGESNQKAFSVGGPANETSMGKGSPFNSDWI